MWTTTRIPNLDVDGFHALAEGRIPALRVPGFASAEECADLGRALRRRSLRTFTVPEVVRLGISQYEQGVRGTKDDYLSQAARLRPEFAAIFAASFDPLGRFIGDLRAAGIDADIMREPDGRAYWAGSGKLRDGATPIHVDFAPQDSPGWAVGDAIAQLAWNLYLDVGDGGDLRLWDRPWEPELDSHQFDASYAYDPAVIDGADALTVPPVVGDVVMVNSRYFHTVTPARHRLTYGSFISVFTDASARLWS